MASEIHMPVPACLIENTPERGLVVRPEALEMLSKITQPVVVVAITGLYRTGKSYLMNRLARQRKGFSLGSSVQSHTKGIWMWCVPHPCQPGHTLVLLDTEGLGDVEKVWKKQEPPFLHSQRFVEAVEGPAMVTRVKGDTKNDAWIFVLTILLSSTLIYNSKGTIDQPAMDQLHYVVKLTDYVKFKAAPSESEDELDDAEKFVLFFPTFIWAVRDFTLQLEIDGKEISEDEYLENALKLKDGSSPEIQRYNQPRECIRQYFPDRKCFVFDQPASKRDLVHLEDLQDDEINPEFQQQVEKFCSHVWENSPTKTVPGGHIITGNRLGKLATTYLETIQSGAVPCLESAVVTLAEIENAAAVKEAVTLYWDLMEQQAKLPTEDLQELLELHSQCEQEALELFMARAFSDDICQFQADLMCQVEAIKAKFCTDNEQASRDKCEAALRDLSQEMEKRISDGVYSVSGGYQLFKEDQQALVEKYWELPGKGVKADAVLQEFLQSRKSLAESILNTDLSLTEKDKKLKSEQEQHERAEQERAVQRQKEAEERKRLQGQLRSYKNHVLRLRKKLKNFCEKQLEEHLEMIRHKSKEEAMLLRDGCFDKATNMHMVTSRLQQEYDSTRNWFITWINMMVSILLGLAFAIFRSRT